LLSSSLFPYTTLFRSRVVVRPADAGRHLVEDDRLFRNRRAGLGRVVGIVEADGDEVADPADAGAEPRIAANERQLVDRCLANLRSEEHTSELQSRGHL